MSSLKSSPDLKSPSPSPKRSCMERSISCANPETSFSTMAHTGDTDDETIQCPPTLASLQIDFATLEQENLKLRNLLSAILKLANLAK